MLIDQFTWVPWAKQTAVIPEMRWLHALTVFPVPLAVGTFSLTRLRPRNAYKGNGYVIRTVVSADDYLSAKHTLYQNVEQILDVLSLVSLRGFRIIKIKSADRSATKTNQPNRTFTEKLKASLVQKTTVQPVPVASAVADENGTAIVNLPPYKEYHVQSNFPGYLEEYVTFTFDAKENRSSKINLSPMKTDDFKARLAQANANYAQILSLGELKSAMRLCRMALQLNDYLTRFIVLWTALESATSVKETGEPNIGLMADNLKMLPGVKNVDKAFEILDKLNHARDEIIHGPNRITEPDFQESLPTIFVKLDWLCTNYLLLKLDLKMLPENTSPL